MFEWFEKKTRQGNKQSRSGENQFWCKKKMEYEIWIKNDINFIATLITKILPALDPG